MDTTDRDLAARMLIAMGLICFVVLLASVVLGVAVRIFNLAAWG